jgi:Icc-related predicted phosphoesterase
MNIKLMSDLHLEFNNPIDPGEGEVLILAGDITTVDTVSKDSAFFSDAANNYDRVFYIPGNHEAYHSDINDAWNIIKSKVDDRITFLDNSSECYNGVHFVGTTLWTSMNNNSSTAMVEATHTMNDYNLIRNGDRSLTALDTYNRHIESVEWLEQVLPTLRGDVVLISHHAPHFRSVKAPGYGSRMPFAYASDLEDLIHKYRNIRLWCHGHAHRRNDYMVGTTRIVANPCGYYSSGLVTEFDPEFTVPVAGLPTVTCPAD